MAVVIGEAAVAIRADASGTATEIQNEVGPAAEKAGKEGGSALAGKLKEALTLAAIGAVVADTFMKGLEQGALSDRLNAQLGASGDYAADLGQIAGDLYAGGYGEGLGDVNEALRSVIQSGAVMEDATNEQLSSVTESALNLAGAFGVDVAEAANAAGRLVQTGLAANAEEAMDIITRGFQQGTDRGGDFLDVLSEYGTTFTEIGLTGAQATGLINQALAAGIPNADFAADALREMGIIGREGSEEAAEALGDLGLHADNYFAAMRLGGPQASMALDTVLDRLRSTEDPALRASAAAALVGTQYEDLGDAILQMDPSAATDSLGQIEGAAGKMGDTLNDNAMARLVSFGREAQTLAVDFLGAVLLPAIEGVATFLSDTFTPVLHAVSAWFSDTAQPAIATVTDYLTSTFGPALDDIRAWVEDEVMPALEKFSDWMTEHKTTIETVATVITALLLPALLRLGVQALVSGAMTAGGWAMSAGGAIATGAVYIAQSIVVIARWVLMGAAAILNAGLTVGAWLGMGIAAVAGGVVMLVQSALVVARWVLMGAAALVQGAVMAVAWATGIIVPAAVAGATMLVQSLLIVGRWIVMGAAALVQGAVMAVAWAVGIMVPAVVAGAVMLVQAAVVVGGWVLMGTQAMLQAARMAAAWFIALGPIGWIAAVVIGIVALIVANWDTVKSKTISIFSAIADFVSGIWGGIKSGIRSGINGIIGVINDFVIGGVNVLIRGVNKVNPFSDIPEVPSIPRLHSGGFFDAPGGGEGLALLESGELVVTAQQRATADTLLTDLLAGRPAAAPGTAGGPASVVIHEHIYPAAGEPAAATAARVTQSVVWNLNGGLTRRAGSEVFA